MPWLPMYLTEQDSPILLNELSQDREIAFIVPDGLKRWRAVEFFASNESITMSLWHIPSGPLPLEIEKYERPDRGQPRRYRYIPDPWAGWEEKETGADPTIPWFWNWLGIIDLNLRLEGRGQNSCCGLSSFGWIGNYYRRYGCGATESTEKWWKSLRRRISKLARKVPRQQLSDPYPPEIFAFPHAYSLLVAGGIADENP
jgi:hypothetical protein